MPAVVGFLGPGKGLLELVLRDIGEPLQRCD
jgi:hypothetical protein